MSVAVTVDVGNIDGLVRPIAVGRAVQEFVGVYARRLAVYMRGFAPKGTQRIHPLSKRTPRRFSLKKKIRMTAFRQKGLASSAFVGSTGVDYAKWVKDGTRQHAIEFRRAKALTIWAPSGKLLEDGTWAKPDEYGFIFTKRVSHPGSKPNNYVQRAIDHMKGQVPSIWSKAFRDKYGEGWEGDVGTAPDITSEDVQ